MNKHLDDFLVEKFPNLYRERNLPPDQSCMFWGFSCGDGWFNIIHKLSRELEAAILTQPEHLREHFRAVQVKEKFGTLRFYLSSYNERMNKAVTRAEKESACTCEDCGEPGFTNDDGYIQTLCDNCRSTKAALKEENFDDTRQSGSTD